MKNQRFGKNLVIHTNAFLKEFQGGYLVFSGSHLPSCGILNESLERDRALSLWLYRTAAFIDMSCFFSRSCSYLSPGPSVQVRTAQIIMEITDIIKAIQDHRIRIYPSCLIFGELSAVILFIAFGLSMMKIYGPLL
jgi:hypothetical protein